MSKRDMLVAESHSAQFVSDRAFSITARGFGYLSHGLYLMVPVDSEGAANALADRLNAERQQSKSTEVQS